MPMPTGQPALALTQKVLERVAGAGLPVGPYVVRLARAGPAAPARRSREW